MSRDFIRTLYETEGMYAETMLSVLYGGNDRNQADSP
jgi:hypothetical protein